MKFDFRKKKRKNEQIEVVPWAQPMDRFPDTTRSSLFASGEDDWDVTGNSPVFQTRTDTGGRSRSYEDFLRARNQTRPWDSSQRSGGRFYDAEQEDDGSATTRRGMQIMGAITLTALLYFTFHSQQPLAEKVQAYIRQEMNQDTSVSALSSWWHQNVSDKLSVPTFGTNTNSNTNNDSASNSDQTKNVKFSMPVQNATVKTAFDGQNQQGITFSAPAGSQVHPVASGLVESVEKAGTNDYTVTISIGSAGKTIYRHLAVVSVKANDFVQADQSIGTLAKTGGSADLFFAYYKDNAYVDPANYLGLPANGK